MTEEKPSRRKAKSDTELSDGDRFRDPMESVSDKISAHLNQFHASTLLLIAWHFTRRRDTVLAQMIQVDRLGFELRCHAHGGRYSEERVNFTAGPVDNAKIMIGIIADDMRRVAAFAKWPNGPLMKVVLAVYGLMCLLYYESHGGEDLIFLPQTWQPHLPKRDLLHWGVGCMLAANFLQSLACLFVLGKRLKLIERAHMFGWFLACFFLGYPAWGQVLALKRANTQGRMKRL